MKQLFRSVASPVLSLSRNTKRLVVLSVDICLCVLATWLALYLRLDEFVAIDGDFARPVFLSVVLAIPIFAAAGLYRAIFRYSGRAVIIAVGRAITLYGLIYLTIVMSLTIEGTPRTVGIIQPLLLFFAVAGSRLFAGFWLGGVNRSGKSGDSLSRVIIYGAGSAGRQLVEALSNGYKMRVIGFFDDDDRLHGHLLNGFPIYAPAELSHLISSKKVTHILLAMPSASRSRRSEILKSISGYEVIVRTLPSMAALADGCVSISDIKDLDIDDLLTRESVKPSHILLAKNIFGKTVLVTGAGGSIGSELCCQILELRPKQILLVEISEYALYRIHSKLEDLPVASAEKIHIVPLLASVQDLKRMREILNIWQPNTLYHAAAYKHVPLVEYNLAEGVKNNVFGTLTTLQLAIENGVSDFVLVSTDKAVRPTNAMGASKRLAELCVQALYAEEVQKKTVVSESDQAGVSSSHYPKIKMCMVRFGNVLDSSGSVIPRFRKQIRDGGPITLTHPQITRYFMTIPEAAQLVIQASAMAEGGDVFVLDMGEPVKIANLARRMIELSGLTVRDEEYPEGDIEIVTTGLRPAEKLYEELLLGDNPQPTRHPKIRRAQDAFMPWKQLETDLKSLHLALDNNNVEAILTFLKELVAGYKPNSDIVDLVYRERTRLDNGSTGLDKFE